MSLKFRQKNGAPLEDLRLTKGGGRAIASNGELNANSKKELIDSIGKLLALSSTGEIKQQSDAASVEAARKAERNKVFASALNNDNEWSDLGVAIAADIDEATTRDGFLRSLVVDEPLSQGQIPRVRVRFPNVTGVVATSAAEVRPQLIRDKYFYPVEFSVTAQIEIENRDVAQATGDMLDEKYRESLQAIMVQEDRLWVRGANASAGVANPVTTFSGALTPTIFATAVNTVQEWALPAATAIMSTDFWPDIATQNTWASVFDPVSQAEILLTGRLGQLYGVSLRTDGFRPPELRVLPRGELYVVSSPEFHGAMTNRGGVEPTPLNGALMGRTTKGWFFSELISLLIANARSVQKVTRS